MSSLCMKEYCFFHFSFFTEWENHWYTCILFFLPFPDWTILWGLGLVLKLIFHSKLEVYSLIRKKSDSTILKNFVREKFRKQFYFFTCILTDYLTHESLKVFWKNSDFENMGASFLRRCQNTLWQNSPEMMHFQAWKKKFLA